jgi:hypothetical protein
LASLRREWSCDLGAERPRPLPWESPSLSNVVAFSFMILELGSELIPRISTSSASQPGGCARSCVAGGHW